MGLLTHLNVSLNSRLFAVGDIHGCPREVETCIRALEEFESLSSDDVLIFLGDYIDRGPDSKAVIEHLLDLQVRYENAFFLKGNHEQMLLCFLGEEHSEIDVRSNYLICGGSECLASYGTSPDLFLPEIVQQFPPSHLEFLRTLHVGITTNDFIFVHAGLDPTRSLHEQEENVLLWIRDEFMLAPHPFIQTVVFGHTPLEEIYSQPPLKLGIDTGLVFGNKLTAVNLTERRVIQVPRNSKNILHKSL
jgi:serine/threonine protein phosphatase 1